MKRSLILKAFQATAVAAGLGTVLLSSAQATYDHSARGRQETRPAVSSRLRTPAQTRKLETSRPGEAALPQASEKDDILIGTGVCYGNSNWMPFFFPFF